MKTLTFDDLKKNYVLAQLHCMIDRGIVTNILVKIATLTLSVLLRLFFFYNIKNMTSNRIQIGSRHWSRDRIVVSTLRWGRSNPDSNPGHGSIDNAGQAMDTFCAFSSLNPDSLWKLVVFWNLKLLVYIAGQIVNYIKLKLGSKSVLSIETSLFWYYTKFFLRWKTEKLLCAMDKINLHPVIKFSKLLVM